jgi:uncharacterized protein (DUF2147 family)
MLIRNYILVFFISNVIYCQSIVGKWKTIDEKTKKELAVIEIYQKNNKYYGKLIKIINVLSSHAECEKCSAKIKNNSLIGKNVIISLNREDKEFKGFLIDPFSDKKYKCIIKYINNNFLNVTAYIGFPIFGRSQNWVRIIE